MSHILIIEDDDRIAQNISKGLIEKDFKTQIVNNGKEGLEIGIEKPFDLVLLDLNLPGLSGYSVCKKLKAEKPDLPIIMLTALGETDDKIEGFNKGADDYMVKPFDFRELLARINVLLKRHGQENPDSTIKIGNLEINPRTKQVIRDNQEIELTNKEYNLLLYLVKRKNEVVSKEELGENVWNIGEGQSLNVVEVYINFLRNKIDKGFTPKLIFTKSGMGYVLKEPF